MKALTSAHQKILLAVQSEECLDSSGRRLGALTPWIRRHVPFLGTPAVRTRLKALANAGLVECDQRPYKATFRWLITDSGRAVIAAPAFAKTGSLALTLTTTASEF